MIKYFISVILIFGILIGAIFLPRDLVSEEEMLFRIEKGQGLKEISLNLQKERLIWWTPIFQTYVLVRGTAGKLQAGTYFLSPSMNVFKIAEKITSGDIAKARITVPEGFTSKQIHDRLQNITESDLAALAAEEGYLFPDTYEIPYGMELNKIIEIMRGNFDKKTANLEITPEIVIMASLLEKEVRTKEDKEIVSGIFWKRLRAGIPLESCATIAYIKGVDQWRYNFEDTRIESPYNTYLNLGLPPASISNPGLESIEAALYPKNSEYWYFLSTSEGETLFSKTLEEHNTAKARYLK